MSDRWSAPQAPGPVTGTVTVPGSKSLTNRLLLLAALADGPSVLRDPLRSRDTELMAAALRALGTAVEGGAVDGTGDWHVTPGAWRGATLDVGNSGTTARFLTAALGLARGDVVVDGDARMRERPLGPLTTALRALGVEVEGDATPLVVHGSGGVPGGAVTVDASASSQLVSGLLLSAPRYDAGLTLRHVGPPVPSTPHLEMTVACLRVAGATVDDSTGDTWRVEPAPLQGRDVEVEPDLSSASAFLAAAAATGGAVTVAGWPEETTQPGRLMPELLERVGCNWTLDGRGLTVTGPGRLRGADLDLREHSESVPTFAALACLADGPTTIRGVAHLRGHETDRLAALREELGLLGAHLTETDDGLRITPAPLHAPERPLDPRADHRLAMAYAVLGLVVPGLLVTDMATVGKTVPDFCDRWAGLVA